MSKSDERRAAKLARKAESRRRHKLRQEKRDERDDKLKAAWAEYKAKSTKIWADWKELV